MGTSYSNLVENWGNYFTLISIVCLAGALLIVLVHESRILFKGSDKARYDYVSRYEIKLFWFAIIFLIASGSLWLTTILAPLIEVDAELKFTVALFFLAGFIIVAYMVLSNLVRILYPRFLEHRLLKIRNRARISSSGNRMRKLPFEEGSVHLDEIQIKEHRSNVHSVEYDVWVDEKTGEKRIEKYAAAQHAEKCDECGFYTMKIDREEVTIDPTFNDEGVLVEHYHCDYCNHRHAKEVSVAPLKRNVAGV